MTKMRKAAVFLLLPSLILGCNKIDGEREQAISPSSKYWLSAEELTSATKAAKNGDVVAMRKVADHYLSSSKEAEGIYWLEKVGNTGDVGARQSVIDYYEHVPQPEDKKGYGAELRKKWNML